MAIDPMKDIYDLINKSIVDNPPISIKEGGGLIKEGYNPELDELKKASTNGKQWLAKLERKEKETTGIKKI